MNPTSDPQRVLASASLLEALAAIEHKRWAHWQQYLHSRCVPSQDGGLKIPAELVARWTAQIKTDYVDLSDDEKESDREQVRSYLPVIADALRAAGTKPS